MSLLQFSYVDGQLLLDGRPVPGVTHLHFSQSQVGIAELTITLLVIPQVPRPNIDKTTECLKARGVQKA